MWTDSTRYLVLALALGVGACGGPATGSSPAGAPREAAAAPVSTTACATISAAEMSNIVGQPVAAEADDGNGSVCTFRPGPDRMPFIEVRIERGGGEAAMVSARLLRSLEPGISDPLDGIGDQASASGPVLMVRTGDDLVQLTLWGVADHLDAARRIIATMRPRMGPSARTPTVSGRPVDVQSGTSRPGH